MENQMKLTPTDHAFYAVCLGLLIGFPFADMIARHNMEDSRNTILSTISEKRWHEKLFILHAFCSSNSFFICDVNPTIKLYAPKTIVTGDLEVKGSLLCRDLFYIRAACLILLTWLIVLTKFIHWRSK